MFDYLKDRSNKLLGLIRNQENKFVKILLLVLYPLAMVGSTFELFVLLTVFIWVRILGILVLIGVVSSPIWGTLWLASVL